MKRVGFRLTKSRLSSFLPTAALLQSSTSTVSSFYSPPCNIIHRRLNNIPYSTTAFASTTDSGPLDTNTNNDNIDNSMASPSNVVVIPAAPHGYLANPDMFLDLSQLDSLLTENHDQRQQAYDLGSQIKVALVKCRASREQSALTNEQRQATQHTLDTLVQQALESHSNDNSSSATATVTTTTAADTREKIRLGNLNTMFADYIRHQAYQHFLTTGTLLSPTTADLLFSDEEYLGGVLGFVNFDLKRYVIGRAAQRDATSVLLARDLVTQLLDHLMQYDFRNGNLRRKYGT
jgi:hypothetical protein